MQSKGKIGFGIIGCGMISGRHADAIAASDGGCLIGVTDKNPKSAEAFAEKYGCLTFRDDDELLSSPDIDVVCICVPSGLHAAYAVKAASAGKHFVTEKPLAITAEQLDAVETACEKHAVKGCVISQLRFSPSVQALKRAVGDGLLGDIVLVDLKMKYYRSPEYYASSPWRGTWSMDGGGALMNQGIHGIDLIQYLVGPISSVSGVCKTMRHTIEVEDTAVLSLEFACGAIGTVTASTSVSPGFPRIIEISGTKGTVTLTENTVTAWNVEGVPPPSDLLSHSLECGGHSDPSNISSAGHGKQISDMIAAVQAKKEPLVSVRDGRMAVEVILAAYEASKSGKKVYIRNSAQ